MNPYTALGLKHDASPVQIKRAFQRLAMRHHPDRGGQVERFKQIVEAYESLKNTQSAFMRGIFDEYWNGNIAKEFSKHKKDYNIVYKITLHEMMNGTQKNITINDNGYSSILNIKIPPGILNGTRIKYANLGRSVNENLAYGDLYVTIEQQKDKVFSRNGYDIEQSISIQSHLADNGGEIIVNDINGSQYSVTIPNGTKSQDIIIVKGAGFPHIVPTMRGDMTLIINVYPTTS